MNTAMKLNSTSLRALLVVAALMGPIVCIAVDSGNASNEARTEYYFQSIRKNPNQLLAFLRQMPKGGDLHNHLVGAIYAESFIDWASEKGLCVDPVSFYLSDPPCGGEKGTVPARQALTDRFLYRNMVDAYSMRKWELSGLSGHDQFFDTFDKFILASYGNTGRMLAETAARAASQHEVYQELMHAAAFPEVTALANRTGWDDDFSRQRDKLLANGIAQVVTAARQEMNDAEAIRNSALRCATLQPDPGCKIIQRYQYMVLRGLPKETVFAQMVLGFEVAGADPRFVGINLVQPEEWYVARRDFALHMQMLQYLHSVYPKVHIALHAGELAQGMVTPEELTFHIRASVETGNAERIGHGMDVFYEDRPYELLAELVQRNVMIEICLTSNATILGIQGDRHPLRQYMHAGVPVALATDDEGVSRSDMTQEFLRGVLDQDLSYAELKKMTRTSLEHAFISGTSLWSDGRNFTPVKECAADLSTPQTPSATCQSFLKNNARANLQWLLESQLLSFESQPWPPKEASPPAPKSAESHGSNINKGQ
ncbi:MAG: adenosine deaminase [Candidatus Korobacteraceae bacterium]